MSLAFLLLLEILFSNYYLLQAFLFAATRQIFYRNRWSDSTKFIFIASNFRSQTLMGVFRYFDNIGITKSILLYHGNELRVFSANKFQRVLYGIPEGLQTCDGLFPDKLTNMTRFAYKITNTPQPPRLQKRSKNLFLSVDMMVMTVIAEKQNALIYPMASSRIDGVFSALESKRADMTVNTLSKLELGSDLKTVNTYDESGFCALVPIPPRHSFLLYLLSPLDSNTWIFVIVTILVCAVIWRLLKRTHGNSEWRFIFSVIVSFIGQGSRLRHNRKVQVLLFQLCLVMTFVIGNCYQSLIISSMMSSRDGERLTTFAELFSSDFKFKLDPVLHDIMNNSGEYESIIDRMEVGAGLPEFEKFARENYVLIGRCDMIDYNYDTQTIDEVDKFFYKLPEKFLPFYEKIVLGPDLPHQAKLQSFFDRVFESGIRQYFEHLLELVPGAVKLRDASFLNNEEYENVLKT